MDACISPWPQQVYNTYELEFQPRKNLFCSSFVHSGDSFLFSFISLSKKVFFLARITKKRVQAKFLSSKQNFLYFMIVIFICRNLYVEIFVRQEKNYLWMCCLMRDKEREYMPLYTQLNQRHSLDLTTWWRYVFFFYFFILHFYVRVRMWSQNAYL